MRFRTIAIASLLPLFVACNQYEMFRVSGYAQESFSNDADILFVIDNSSSMKDESEALGANFDVFISKLTDPALVGGQDGLSDAVDNYINYVQNRGGFLDYQLAITTTDVANTYGELYSPPGDPEIIAKGDEDVEEQFLRNLFCESTFWPTAEVPNDGDHECEDPINDDVGVSRQYLDCLCGAGAWANAEGSGTEEHLEAVFMAMCRAAEDPPNACYNQNQFEAADELTNEGLLREDSTLIVVIITDEGDVSRRMTTGDGDPEDSYAELFSLFGQRMTWAVIGPTTESCNAGSATTWGVERLQYFVDDTNGRWFDITNEPTPGNCEIADFASSLDALGELLNGLLDLFPLQSVPDVETIIVFVDGEPISESVAVEDEDTGELDWPPGWSYNAAENAVLFHGEAIPDYNADVKIFYRPLEGMPRELPFE